MEKKLNPSEGESELDEDLNLEEEDFEEEELEFLDEDEESEEESDKEEPEDKSQLALDILNEQFKLAGLNKNYKSFDDVIKSEKQRDAEFARKGTMEEEKKPVEKQEEEQPQPQVVTTSPAMSERLLRLENPDSVYVIEQIKKDFPGRDVLEVFESSEYYKQEALTRGEQERARQRVANPQGGAGEGEGGKPANDTEAYFMDESKLPPGMGFLPRKK